MSAGRCNREEIPTVIDALAQPVTLPLWMVLVLAGFQRVLSLVGDAREQRRRQEDKEKKQARGSQR